MRCFMVLVFVVAGCGNQMRASARVGTVEREVANSAAGKVVQSGGRDTVNLSPTLAVSGGGGVVFLIVCALGMNWARTRRTLKTVVSAVEGLDTAVAGKVKTRVLRGALNAGVADFLHGHVKRWGKYCQTPPRHGRRSRLPCHPAGEEG
jgi:hypothetical protein